MLFIVILSLILAITGLKLAYETFFPEGDEYRDTLQKGLPPIGADGAVEQTHLTN